MWYIKGVNDSPLTRADLQILGIPPSALHGKIFKATRGMSKQDAAVVALKIFSGEWIEPASRARDKVINNPNSVINWLIRQDFVPSITAPNPMWASKSDKRRMLAQGAIRINWHTDWKEDDEMPETITEVTLFPNGDRRTLLFCISCSSSCPHALEMKEDLERQEQKEEEKRKLRQKSQGS